MDYRTALGLASRGSRVTNGKKLNAGWDGIKKTVLLRALPWTKKQAVDFSPSVFLQVKGILPKSL